jgi:hypothetical protein
MQTADKYDKDRNWDPAEINMCKRARSPFSLPLFNILIFKLYYLHTFKL